MVQFAEIQIGKVLAGQVADRHPLACHATRQGMIHDAVQEVEQLTILELAPVQPLEYPVVDRLEVPLDVAEQGVGVLACQILHAPHARMDALSPSARECIGDQASIEEWVEHVADCVMHDSIPIVGRADPT